MSRLGDLMRLERTRRKLTEKQVAKMSGVSESFIKEVEAGTRIIADTEARRILKKMGTTGVPESAFTLEDIAAAVDLKTAAPKAPRPAAPKAKAAPAKEAEPAVPGSIWLDALKGVLHRVPIYNAVMQEVGHRLLPLENGKLFGVQKEKVFYYQMPDAAMQGARIKKGDLVLVLGQSTHEDNAVMLVETANGRLLRRVKELPRFQIMLQSYNDEADSPVVNLADVRILGRAIRLEAAL